MDMYPGASEDFAGADLKKLDLWVFNKVKVGLTKCYPKSQNLTKVL